MKIDQVLIGDIGVVLIIIGIGGIFISGIVAITELRSGVPNETLLMNVLTGSIITILFGLVLGWSEGESDTLKRSIEIEEEKS